VFSYTRESAIEAFDGHWGGYARKRWYWDDSTDPNCNDLSYLLSEYNLTDEAALLALLGTSVIGNIYENPELLTN